MVHGVYSLHIILYSLFFIYLSYKLLVFSNGRIKVFTIPNFFMLKYIIFIYLGSVLYNVVFFNLELNSGMYKNLDHVFNIWLYSSIAIILVPLGMSLSKLFFKIDNSIQHRHILNMNYSHREFGARFFFLLILILSVSVISLLYYRSILGELPIFQLFYGGSDTLAAVARSDAGNNFSGKLHWFKFFINACSKILFILVFFSKHKSIYWKLFFYITLFYVAFVSIMNLNKAPIIDLIILLFVSGFFLKKKLKIKQFVKVGIIIFSALIVMYVFFMGQSDKKIFEILQIILHRIFVSQVVPFYWYQEYQQVFGFLYGQSFPNPGGILPFENISITTETYAFAYPERIKLGIVGSLPTVFFADWWSNFGAIGAVFSMLLLGFILQSVDYILKQFIVTKKSFLIISFYIYVMFYMSKFVGTSYVGIIFDFEIILITLLFITLYLFNKLKLKK